MGWGILGMISLAVFITKLKYAGETQDTSWQGYFEHIKEKYWDKKEASKPPCHKEGNRYIRDYEENDADRK